MKGLGCKSSAIRNKATTMQDDTPDLSNYNIQFADQTVVSALDDYVQEILDKLADCFNQPGIAQAWVSDESMVCDFLPSGFESPDDSRRLRIVKRIEHEQDPEKAERLRRYLASEDLEPSRAQAKQMLIGIGKDLGISIRSGDYIYELAVKLRDK